MGLVINPFSVFYSTDQTSFGEASSLLTNTAYVVGTVFLIAVAAYSMKRQAVPPPLTPEQRTRRNSQLWLAARDGNLEEGKALLKAGASAESSNERGVTALICAAGAGHIAFTNLLLKNGAKRDAVDSEGAGALHHAASKGQTRVISTLLQRRASVDQATHEGYTPLMFAADSGQQAAAALLLKVKASVNHLDSHKYSPLFIAAQAKRPEMEQLLLDHNADPIPVTTNGEDVLMVSLREGETATAKRLLYPILHKCLGVEVLHNIILEYAAFSTKVLRKEILEGDLPAALPPPSQVARSSSY